MKSSPVARNKLATSSNQQPTSNELVVSNLTCHLCYSLAGLDVFVQATSNQPSSQQPATKYLAPLVVVDEQTAGGEVLEIRMVLHVLPWNSSSDHKQQMSHLKVPSVGGCVFL